MLTGRVTINFTGVPDPFEYAAVALVQDDEEICSVNLQGIKRQSLKTWYPHMRDRSQPMVCTLMLLSNLMEPHWLNVGCTTKLLAHVLCTEQQTNDINGSVLHDQDSQKHDVACSWNTIALNDSCFAFLWYGNIPSFKNLCAKNRVGKPVNFHPIHFEIIFDGTEVILPPMITWNGTSTTFVSIWTCTKTLNVYSFSTHLVSSSHAEGFQICSAPPVFFNAKYIVFLCSNGGFVSVLCLCDDVIDCPNDNSDEQFCVCAAGNNSHAQCR